MTVVTSRDSAILLLYRCLRHFENCSFCLWFITVYHTYHSIFDSQISSLFNAVSRKSVQMMISCLFFFIRFSSQITKSWYFFFVSITCIFFDLCRYFKEFCSISLRWFHRLKKIHRQQIISLNTMSFCFNWYVYDVVMIEIVKFSCSDNNSDDDRDEIDNAIDLKFDSMKNNFKKNDANEDKANEDNAIVDNANVDNTNVDDANKDTANENNAFEENVDENDLMRENIDDDSRRTKI